MKAQTLAKEVAARYFMDVNDHETHAENVQKHLRGPAQAVTLYILLHDEEDNVIEAAIHPAPNEEEEEKKSSTGGKADWRDCLASMTDASTPDLVKVNQEAFDALGRRTKARLEAFLTGVSMAVSVEPVPTTRVSSTASFSSDENGNCKTERKDSVKSKARSAISLAQGLAGFDGEKKNNNGIIFRSISTQSSASPRPAKYHQMNESALVTRLELYIRSLCRVKAQGQECVIAAEPPRAMKCRARSLVVAFIDTVDTVHQQSIVLNRLISALIQELLAVEFLSESLTKLIHRMISDYVQSVSFASLAFLSSPEASADQRLTPMLLKFLRYLQTNWRDCVAECELERMLTLSIDPDLRRTLKTIVFHSIGHLLEVCQGFRNELNHISLGPDMRAVGGCGGGAVGNGVDNNDAIRQALRDLQREVITVNSCMLPPVTSRKELISLLSQTLSSRTLTSAAPIKPRRRATPRSTTARLHRRGESDGALLGERRVDKSGDELTSSGEETDFSGYNVEFETNPDAASSKGTLRRRRSFRLSTVDFLTKRLLLAASRTGTGGDAYFVVRDLFGGEDVEVVPSQFVYTHGRNVRPGSIEINVKLASVTIKCHGSFDVYPKSMVGDCEPLIQLHTTTSETIALQEVRATDSSSDVGSKHDDYDDSDDDDRGPVMVVQERKTERTGWRYLSIRPALYEKYEEFSTPS